jgi:hypothetical protein
VVNFSLFARRNGTFTVSVTCFAAVSMIDTVPSCAFATQSSLPSGERSNPSAPRPTGTTVTRQSPPVASMMHTLAEPRFDVKSRRTSLDAMIMCVPSCPVLRVQSTLWLVGSYRPIEREPSAVK